MNPRQLLIGLLALVPAHPAPALETPTLAIENVTVIGGPVAARQEGVTVLVADGRIRSVTPQAGSELPDTAARIDGDGHFLMPGLIDMHAHLAFGPVTMDVVDGRPTMKLEYDEAASRQLAGELLRHGITTARNPGGPTEHALAVRDALESGAWKGPRVATAGSVIDAGTFVGLVDPVNSAASVREAVRRQAEAGVDLIKLYASLPPEQLKAGIEAAHEAGLPAIGHLMATDWRQASALGLDGIVHAMPTSASLLPEPERDAYRSNIRGTQFMYEWFEHAELDGPIMREALERMADNGVHLDPTLVAVESIFFGDRERIRENPALRHVPDVLLENWRGGMTLTPDWTAADFERARAVFPKAQELVRLAQGAGVTLVAGTDVGNPWIVPGESLHRELELYVAAGLTPGEAIRTATVNAATVLGMRDEVGTVEPGKRANLLLLDADPLVDIRHTRDIALVIQTGRIVHDFRQERTP